MQYKNMTATESNQTFCKYVFLSLYFLSSTVSSLPSLSLLLPPPPSLTIPLLSSREWFDPCHIGDEPSPAHSTKKHLKSASHEELVCSLQMAFESNTTKRERESSRAGQRVAARFESLRMRLKFPARGLTRAGPLVMQAEV